MTEAQYTKVCEDYPDLKLPPYWQLAGIFLIQLAHMTPDELIAARLSAIIGRRDSRKPDESKVIIGDREYTLL